MVIHVLDYADFCPSSALLVNGQGGLLQAGHLACRGLLLEHEQGLVLVDAGFGLMDVHEASVRLNWTMLAASRPQLREDRTAIRHVERLGFQASDVKHIILTHLDPDHAGGISDFPEATVHVSEREWASARGLFAPPRYAPIQWRHSPNWVFYEGEGTDWFGFESWPVLGGDLRLVPLPGHTLGHCGVAIHDGDGWLLHAGDAFFLDSEMALDARHCSPLLDGFQRLGALDRSAWEDSQRKLRRLRADHGDEVRILCAHAPEKVRS